MTANIPEPVTAETEDLREFLAECAAAIPECVARLPRPEGHGFERQAEHRHRDRAVYFRDQGNVHLYAMSSHGQDEVWIDARSVTTIEETKIPRSARVDVRIPYGVKVCSEPVKKSSAGDRQAVVNTRSLSHQQRAFAVS